MGSSENSHSSRSLGGGGEMGLIKVKKKTLIVLNLGEEEKELAWALGERRKCEALRSGGRSSGQETR